MSENTVVKAKELKFTFPALNVAICGKWVWVSGPTRDYKDALKAKGLKFSSKKAMWYLAPAGFFPRRRPGMEYTKIVQRYGEAKIIPVDQTQAAAA